MKNRENNYKSFLKENKDGHIDDIKFDQIRLEFLSVKNLIRVENTKPSSNTFSIVKMFISFLISLAKYLRGNDPENTF